MRLKHFGVGFEGAFNYLTFTAHREGVPKRIVAEANYIGNHPEAWKIPGSSALWLGGDFRFDREQIAQLNNILVGWLNSRAFLDTYVPPKSFAEPPERLPGDEMVLKTYGYLPLYGEKSACLAELLRTEGEYLWINDTFKLNQQQVFEFAMALTTWLTEKKLPVFSDYPSCLQP
jgi:hypothetical protein